MRKPIYLDHSATTPLREEVFQQMVQAGQLFGNPSSIHIFGREAKRIAEAAREKLARAVNAPESSIIFTSGGTEADNLAIIGAALGNADRGKHIIISCIEHHAVAESARYLETLGFRISRLPVDQHGIISLDDLQKALAPDTIIVSIMHASNEIGSVQPIAEIGKITKKRNIIFHTDAVQTLGKLPLDIQENNIDLLAASAHKLYGPKGIGCLCVRNGVRLQPLFWGGGQERGLRPGTENVAGIVGFGTAVELAVKDMTTVRLRLELLRDYFLSGLQRRIEGVVVNGHPYTRLPGHVHLSFAGLTGAELVKALDGVGIAVSAGAACTAGQIDYSPTLREIGLIPELARGSIRISMGRETGREAIDCLLDKLPTLVQSLRQKNAAGQ